MADLDNDVGKRNLDALNWMRAQGVRFVPLKPDGSKVMVGAKCECGATPAPSGKHQSDCQSPYATGITDIQAGGLLIDHTPQTPRLGFVPATAGVIVIDVDGEHPKGQPKQPPKPHEVKAARFAWDMFMRGPAAASITTQSGGVHLLYRIDPTRCDLANWALSAHVDGEDHRLAGGDIRYTGGYACAYDLTAIVTAMQSEPLTPGRFDNDDFYRNARAAGLYLVDALGQTRHDYMVGGVYADYCEGAISDCEGWIRAMGEVAGGDREGEVEAAWEGAVARADKDGVKPGSASEWRRGKRNRKRGKRKRQTPCYRDCNDAIVENDVVVAIKALDARFRIIQNRLHRVDDDGFWRQYSDGSRSALARCIVQLTNACVSCANPLSSQVWHQLYDEWVLAGRPQPNQFRAFRIDGMGYRAFTISGNGSVALREVNRDMLLTHKPTRLIGRHTEEWPQTMLIEESGGYIPLMRGWRHETRYQFVRMFAKSLDRDAMFGDDDIVNLIGDPGTGKGTLIEQLKALLDGQGIALPIQKRQGMHWSEDKAFTRNNIVVINEANNPNAEYVERALAASDSTIEVNEKNEPIVQEVARCRIVFVGTRNIAFEAATGMGRRITPFISGGESHVDGGEDDEVKRFAVTDGEVTRLFWRMVDSLPAHHRVGNPVSQVRDWKLRVLDDGDPVRAWIREFVEVVDDVATPLRHFVDAYCDHAGLKARTKASPKVESALRALSGVDIQQAAPRRPKSVTGAKLIDGVTQAAQSYQ